jgi:hypothetical protein
MSDISMTLQATPALPPAGEVIIYVRLSDSTLRLALEGGDVAVMPPTSSTGEASKVVMPVAATSTLPGGLRLLGLAIATGADTIPSIGATSLYYVAPTGYGNGRAVIRSRSEDGNPGLLVEAQHFTPLRITGHTTEPLLQLRKGTGYLPGTLESGAVTKFAVSDEGAVLANRTITAAATVGPQTINKPAGTVNFAAGASSLVVTNSTVTASSLIFAQVRTNDSTAKIKNVVAASGSFTINLEAAATAETSVGFFVTN